MKPESIKSLLSFIIFSFVLFACKETTNQFEPNAEEFYVPKHFPKPEFPVDNQYSKAKETLGKYLFFDKIFSHDYSLSCASCHNPRFAFANNLPSPIGSNRISIPRNVLSLANVVYRKTLGWNGNTISLEDAIYHDFDSPIFFANDTNEIFKRLINHPFYPKLFEEAFGRGTKPYPYLASKAIATFVRTLISGNSAYDRYIAGDSNALTPKQKFGMNLFFSERTNCSKCHSEFLFTDEDFHNTGTTTHYFDRGRFVVTNKYSDRHKFKTPSLRNVEVTAPYLHDGTYSSLFEIIENYDRGGLPFFNKDTLLKPLHLTQYEKEALVEFLKALTDWEFINSKRFESFGK